MEMAKATSILSKYLPSYTGKRGCPALAQCFPQYEFAPNDPTIAQYIAQHIVAPEHPNLQFPEQKVVARDHPLLARFLPRQMASQYHGQMAETADILVQHLPKYAVALYHPTPIHYHSPSMASSHHHKMAVAQYGGRPPMNAISLIRYVQYSTKHGHAAAAKHFQQYAVAPGYHALAHAVSK